MTDSTSRAGRIPKEAFIGASSAFLAVCVLASFVRFYVRFWMIREFGWDDGFLIAGLCCLIAGLALLFVMIDSMYETEYLLFFHGPGSSPMPDDEIKRVLARALWYKKFWLASATLLWMAICCAKFSFLALFKRLTEQVPRMNQYWWFCLVFNVVAMIYGVTPYGVSCPYERVSTGGENASDAVECAMGDSLRLAMAYMYSPSQMVLDSAGDLFILVIPCVLIWQIRVRFTQKLALGFTLCLTIIMIVITVVRITGLRWRGKPDSVWETFFIIMAAEIGLSLVAVTAFRELYVSKTRHRRQADDGDNIRSFGWYGAKSKSVFRPWAAKGTVTTSSSASNRTDGFENMEMGNGQFIGYEVSGGTMTGLQTFVEANGRTVYLTNTIGTSKGL
ncbi:hypothetical protein QBC43DRAFT_310179 [Cladorrhinum sp. PSN259]|nr:hypothetical protein QBC43DRAFT_310179 [Cladorrhinum sp. PSN259]